MRITRKELVEGGKIPWNYGIAYWHGCVAICYPIPLHLAVRILRDLHAMLMSELLPLRWVDEKKKEYDRGYKDGAKAGAGLGMSVGMKILERLSSGGWK